MKAMHDLNIYKVIGNSSNMFTLAEAIKYKITKIENCTQECGKNRLKKNKSVVY